MRKHKIGFRLYLKTGKSQYATVQYSARYMGIRKSGTTEIQVRRSHWNKLRSMLAPATPGEKKIRAKLLDLQDYVTGELTDEFIESENRLPIPEEFFLAIQSYLQKGMSKIEMGSNPWLTDLINELVFKKINKAEGTIEMIKHSKRTVEDYEKLNKKKLRASDFNYDHARGMVHMEVDRNSVSTAKLRMVYILDAINEKKKEVNRKPVPSRTVADVKILHIPDLEKKELFKGYEAGDKQSSERPYLKIEEMIDIYEKSKTLDDKYRYIIHLYTAMYFTGMRRNELESRKYGDLVTRTAPIDGKLTQIRGVINESVKGKKQDLFTPCHDILLEIIEFSRTDDDRDPLNSPLLINFSGRKITDNVYLKNSFEALGYKFPETGLLQEIKVVDYSKGYRNETISKKYVELTYHTARHGFGAFLLQNGATMQDVSEFLGHSSIKLTEGWYKHIDLTKGVHKANEMFNAAVLKYKKREDTTPPQELQSS